MAETTGKFCKECGQLMWVADLDGFGPLWNCLGCRESVDGNGKRFTWYRPRAQESRPVTSERRYQGRQPCPRCGQNMWVIEVPNYGSRQQCADCRISVVSGAVLEWRGAGP